MKRFLLLAWCFAFAVAQVTRAGDGVPKSSGTAQRVARPVFSTVPRQFMRARAESPGQPNWSGRRAPRVFPQQTHFTSFRNPQTRQVPEASRQRGGGEHNQRQFPWSKQQSSKLFRRPPTLSA